MSTIAKNVLVGGGTGFIGQRLSNHLTQNGYNVTAISRMPGLRRVTWHEIEKHGIPMGISAVVNLAGQNVLDPTRRWTPGFKQNVWNSRINSCAALVKAIENSLDVRAFINISGVSHYRCDDQIHTEEGCVEGYDFMSRLCLEWEKAATIPFSVKCRNIKIRTGVVIGRGGGMIQSIMLPFKLGLGGPMGTGKQPLPWIHIHDLCRLIQFSIENPKVQGVLNGVAPEICTNGEFCKTFGSVLNRPTYFAVPEFLVNLLFGKDRSVLLLKGPKVEPKRAVELGFRYKYPTAKAACQEVVKNT